MTIGEYCEKLQSDLQQAASEKDYCACRELVGTLELLDGLPPDAPAHFLTFSEIMQIHFTAAELADELDREHRIPAGESFRIMYKFLALMEAYNMRGEEKTLAVIADLVRAALPAPPVAPSETKSAVMAIGGYRSKITEDRKQAEAVKDTYHAGNLAAILELIQNLKDDAPAHFLTFSDILRIEPAAQDLAQDLYKKGDITSNQRWQIVGRFFALAEGFKLRQARMPLEKIAMAVRWRLQKEGWL